MPSPGIYKTYIEHGIYHLYNRGNDKQKIFRDEKDYKVFLSLLWKYLKADHQSSETKEKPLSLLCYCLMPNHFHFLVKQLTETAITDFMKRLLIKYVMYFNKRHQRKGRLFQSIFKAKLIEEESYLLHVSRYIHLNPQETWPQDLSTYPYSSYATYMGKVQNSLLNTEEIVSFFRSAQNLSLKDYRSYQAFVEDYNQPKGTTLGYQFLG